MLDLPEGNAMRAPGEAPGMMALEIAMDEMAEKLGLDPIEFRIRNDTQVDPEKPDAALLAAPARRVPAHRRRALRLERAQRRSPAQVRDGRWLVGMGIAAAFRNNLVTKSAARVRLDGRGIVTVETDMTDIGTGSYTIIAQTAAEMMGVPLDKVVVRLGDFDLPGLVPARAGNGARNSSTAGVYAACVKLREAVAQKLGFNSADVAFADGRVALGQSQRAARRGRGRRRPRRRGRDRVRRPRQAATSSRPSARTSSRSASMPRPARSACAACSPSAPPAASSTRRSARSQVIGAMTMGAGAALMEELAVDKRLGFFVNHDLAGYEVPVHADIPHQDVIFLDETDPISSPMKAKGVGELGICGVARGHRQRDLQRHRRARARLSDHARQAARPAAARPERRIRERCSKLARSIAS